VLVTDLCEGNYFEDVKQEKLHFIVQKGLIIRYCERRGFLATHGVRKRIFIGIVINVNLWTPPSDNQLRRDIIGCLFPDLLNFAKIVISEIINPDAVLFSINQKG